MRSGRASAPTIGSALLTTAVFLSLVPSLAAAENLPPVTVTETAELYTLANGRVTAKVLKNSGSLASLVYNGIEVLNLDRRHPGGYWSHTASAPRVLNTITIDPKTNGGRRGEVSIKGISGGTPLGSGPGGSVVADIEIRYALGRGDPGVYTYSIFEHQPDYPATSLGEARFCAKLNDEVFDWMTVDSNRNQRAITAYDWNHGIVLNVKEARRMTSGTYQGQVEHKYDYSAVQFDIPAFGWSSTSRHIGAWIVNPTIEYLSGGPTKVELCVHRDATFGSNPNAPAPPCMLNYWRGSHYGGSSCNVAAGEHWTKVVGPFLIYCNSGPTPEAMWKDALAAAAKEAGAWPYDWVKGVDYPRRDERGTVSGQLVLVDPQAPRQRMKNLLVGLSTPDYTTTSGRRGPSTVDWQLDAKHYQFWVRGDDLGRFSIPNVRPGTYTLHAIADGVLGEFSKLDIVVGPEGKRGQSPFVRSTLRAVPANGDCPLFPAQRLGRLVWTPTRFGQQLWEIGIPDRTAAEFRHGDHYWQWGLYLKYPQEFLQDVNFVIGKSDWRTDWNYCQPPRVEGDRVTPTTWSITFDMPQAARGKATLRLAIAGSRTRRGIEVSVNDTPVGGTGPLPDTGVMHRDGIRGYWCERSVPFDASLLKAGKNVIKLHVPATHWTEGVLYDYLRLEIDDHELHSTAPARAGG